MSSTQISEAKAKEYISYYRQNLPAGSLKSAWLNHDFIDAVIALSITHQLDGVRVCMAKYSEDDPGGKFKKDEPTVIIVPTQMGLVPNVSIDVVEAYYDYSYLCPPHCDGDQIG